MGIQLPFVGIRTFMKRPHVTDWDNIDADVAVLGAPFDLGTVLRPGARFGPAAIREGSQTYHAQWGWYDPEDGCHYLDPSKVRIVDLGDVEMIHFDAKQCIDNIRNSMRRVVRSGALPVVIGGDHSIHAPCIEAYDVSGFPSIHIVHIDAHLDYVDERGGVRYGQGNALRRAAALPYVTGITHVGIRGSGSSMQADYEAALAAKSHIVTMRKFRRMSLEEVTARIPDDAVVYFTVDIDAFDPSIAPGTTAPSVGGLGYEEVMELVRHVALNWPVVGLDLVEVCPPCDEMGRTALFAAQLLHRMLSYLFGPGALPRPRPRADVKATIPA
jgi:agmatinase